MEMEVFSFYSYDSNSFLLIKTFKACYRPDVSFGSVDLDPMCQDPFAEKIKVDFQDQLLEEIEASAEDSEVIKVIVILFISYAE